MSNPFDGGGGGSSSNAATATNDTTVNVTVDNTAVAEALLSSANSLAISNAKVADINSVAIQSVAAGMAATAANAVNAIQANTKATMDAYAAHVDGGSKATIVAALIGAAALMYHKSR